MDYGEKRCCSLRPCWTKHSNVETCVYQAPHQGSTPMTMTVHKCKIEPIALIMRVLVCYIVLYIYIHHISACFKT